MNRILACLLLLTTFLHAKDIDSADNTIVLGERVGLIKPGMTAADIVKAYGKGSLKDAELAGAEGSTYPGAKLFEGTDRELEISWQPDNESKKIVFDVSIVGKAWKFENGLKAGMTIEEVEKINGKPFKVNGFGWDYGGFAEFEGGKLDAKVSIRFGTGEGVEVPDAISGDQQIPSTSKKLRAAKPRVESPISVFMR